MITIISTPRTTTSYIYLSIKTENEVIITAIAIEKHNYDENKYKELEEKESWAMQNIGKMSNCPKRSL
jgi:hypothetical protein